ncbi:hypothetical protein BGW42_000925, partial [Actinomortierella wolfii]
LEDPIGCGASATIFLSLRYGQLVAVKKLHHRGKVEFYRKEIELCASLNHKNIIQFRDICFLEGELVMVMDFAEEGSLRRVIKVQARENKKFDWPTMTRIRSEIAAGLTYLHSNGIIHRDIKSGNILLTKNLEVRICDFGLALVKSQPDSMSNNDRSRYEQNSIVGTLRWMAPESLGANPKYSFESDMFAFGMVMWEMAANYTVPYRELENTRVAEYVRSGGREIIPDDTPYEYRHWINRCWEEDPSKRPKAQEMVQKAEIEVVGHLSTDGDSMVSDSGPSGPGTFGLNRPNENKRAPSSVPLSKTMDNVRARPSKSLISEPPRSIITMLLAAGNDISESDTTPSSGPWLSTSISSSLSQVSDKCALHFSQAAAGNKRSQLLLGCWSISGAHGLPINYSQAHHWLLLASQGPCGKPVAARLLGLLYEYGVGVAKNREKAFSFYLHAADQHDLLAQLEISLMYRHGNRLVSRDHHQAFHWMWKAAQSGNPVAECGLGWHFECGVGVAKDLSMAISWYTKSAAKSYHEAQCRLGWLYLIGQGVQRDIQKAIALFKSAAEHGHIEAHFRLKALYSRICLYRARAILSTQPAALTNRHLDTNEIQHRTVMDDQVELFYLGQDYEYGNGEYIQPDANKACEFYSKSADHGYVPAIRALGALYLSDHAGVETLCDSAHQHLVRAANLGDDEASTWLAWSFLMKEKQAETRQALPWLKRAASRSEPIALATMGRFYDRGEAGLPKDAEQAKRFYSLAADKDDPIAKMWLSKACVIPGDPGSVRASKQWKTQAQEWFVRVSQDLSAISV